MTFSSSLDSSLFDGMAIFVALINHGSFTKAALASGHSTSYISKQMNKLEERLGVRLLNRTTRTLSLTTEGQMFYSQCQQLVDDAIEVQQALSGHQHEPTGTLKVSCPVSLGMSMLQPIIAEFMSTYPKVKLELELNDRKVDLVAEGFDLAIRASRKQQDSSLISRCIMRSKAVVIVSPKYVDKYGMPKTPLELPLHKTISYSNISQPDIWEFIGLDGDTFSVKVDSHVLTNSAEMEIALCIAGQGITQMPSFNLHGEIEDGRLIELFKDYNKHQIEVHVVYPSRKHMSAKVRHFIDFIIARLEA
jgi:DNA-binding transcriptional LysR family regulator